MSDPTLTKTVQRVLGQVSADFEVQSAHSTISAGTASAITVSNIERMAAASRLGLSTDTPWLQIVRTEAALRPAGRPGEGKVRAAANLDAATG